MSKRIFAFLLAAMMLLSCTCALAADVWACENCGAADNSGNFCPNCGTGKPVPVFAIVSQPVSVEAEMGETVVFTVVAQNAADYQWQWSKDSESWFASTNDAGKMPSITYEATDARYSYYFRCLITDVNGEQHTTDVVRIIKPAAAEDAPWDCACGTKNNTGKFCPVCGKDKSNAVTGNVPATNSKVKVGQYVKFGSYEQDGNDVNGKEPIQWRVLAVEGDKALLISRYGLSRQPFNKTSSGETWEDCGLRTWMNKTFYKAAFTYDQQQSILTTTIKEDISQCSGDFPPNRLGNNTQDKVFTLSYVEMTEYLPTDYDRLCVPTEAAILEDCNESDRRYLDDEEKTCWYWMRSPAYNNNILVVGWEGEIDTCYMSHYYGVARPAMWVESSALK